MGSGSTTTVNCVDDTQFVKNSDKVDTGRGKCHMRVVYRQNVAVCGHEGWERHIALYHGQR